MTRRTIAVLWLVVGIALWNGIFDLYVSRGAREYLQLRAESELGLVPPPSMAVVMARAERMGLDRGDAVGLGRRCRRMAHNRPGLAIAVSLNRFRHTDVS